MKTSGPLTLIAMLSLLTTWTAPASFAHDAPAGRPSRPPNILLVMLDDLGKDWVTCCGGGEIETPNVDRLAAGGMRLANAYCMPQCTPTRVTLLTGQYPFRHGWVNHWDVPRWGHGYFDWKRNPSIARVMKSAGYTTAVAGKWQINDFRVHPDALQEQGFDDWCVWTGGEAGNRASNSRYWDPYIHTRRGSRTYEGRFGPDVFTEFLIDFMRKHRQERMFLYFPMCLTHGPLVSTPLEPDAKGRLERHKAMVRYADHLLGKLIGALESLKLREDTIVIWTTDNGSAVSGTLHGHKVSGGKAKTTEMGVCVPFIVNCPGRVPQGVVSDALTDFTGLLPTCAELAGAKLPDGCKIDGVSIAGHLLGRVDDSPRRWIMAMGGQNRARLTDKGVENEWYFRDRVLRDNRYKLYVGTDRRPEELIDLRSDPAEEHNLLDSPDPAAQAAVKKFMAAVETFPEKDSDPAYGPPQPAYVKVTAESGRWKKGRPER